MEKIRISHRNVWRWLPILSIALLATGCVKSVSRSSAADTDTVMIDEDYQPDNVNSGKTGITKSNLNQ